ncbi:MAG: hypothetical protein M9918_26180 [Anaerolineae bacterium]|nr:hypothetical protein [Anaerolineae bacterium]MCO5191665.1 hypothetical protein [Anaerolineae bacterium]
MTFYVVGIFEKHDQVDIVLDTLDGIGVTNEAITLLTSAESDEIAGLIDTQPEKGALQGALAGTVIGGTLGTLGTVALVTVPGLGPVIASGVIAILSSGVIGGYLGALYGTRAETDDVIDIKNEISAENIIAIAQTADRALAERCSEIFEAHSNHPTHIVEGE